MKDYYKILRVKRFSSPEVVRAAYLTLAKQYHPDKNKSDSYFFTEYFKEIKEAYENLMDNDFKSKYDDILLANPELINTNLPAEINLTTPTKITLKTRVNGLLILFFSLFIAIALIYIIILQTKLKSVQQSTVSRSLTVDTLNLSNIESKINTEGNTSNDLGKVPKAKPDKNAKLIPTKNNSNNTLKKSSIDKNNDLPPIKSNYCENISIIYSEREFIINNKNKFTVDKVEVLIFYEEQKKIGFSEVTTSVTEKMSFLEVKPGKGTWFSTTRRMEMVLLSSAEDELNGLCE